MGFTFKQFHIDDDQCAMKVGTDSILLGSVVDIDDVTTVLDIGSGCGLLGLMLSQRLAGKGDVSCVEIDEAACKQAEQNVLASPWAGSVSVLHGDINQFNAQSTFDLIISNPPYFSNSLNSPDKARNQARHTDSLSLVQLAQRVVQLLGDEGKFWLILPVDAANVFEQQADAVGLYLHQRIAVKTKRGKPVHRYIMAFTKIAGLKVAQSAIDVYDEKNQYSRQFIALTKNFYLNR